MTSSSSFELTVLQRGVPIGSSVTALSQVPVSTVLCPELDTRYGGVLEVGAGADCPAASLRIGSRVQVRLEPGTRSRVLLDEIVEEQCGELVLELLTDPETGAEAALLGEYLLPLTALASIEELYHRLLEDLDEIHSALACDISGMTRKRRGPGRARILQPDQELKSLQAWQGRLDALLSEVATQPSTFLVQETHLARWRSGDRLDSHVISSITRNPCLVWRDRVPTNPGRVPLSRRRLSLDLEEHRHLRAGIEHLVARSRSLAATCERSMELIERDRRRWGGHIRGSASVFHRRHGSRLGLLRRLSSAAVALQVHLAATIDHYEFLREAGVPRTPLGVTPIFSGRPTYRRVFDMLRSIRRDSGPCLDGDDLRLRLKDLDTLYEYWCYSATVATLRDILGPPRGAGFLLHDEYYRPDLVPGQSFTWRPSPDVRVTVWYEPDITPAHWRTEGPLGMRAVLVDAPLRPDVLITVDGPDSRLRALVLDAKNTARFSRSRLFDISDYRGLVVMPESGHQPVRQVFLLHRDTGTPPISNVPRYFEPGFVLPRESSVLGGFLTVPGQRENLEIAVRKFLEGVAY